jgi:hypothetical protein
MAFLRKRAIIDMTNEKRVLYEKTYHFRFVEYHQRVFYRRIFRLKIKTGVWKSVSKIREKYLKE